MRTLLFIFTFLTVSLAYAQEDVPLYPTTKPDSKLDQKFKMLKEKGDKIAGVEKEEKAKSAYTEEYSIFYAKLGQPIFSINGQKSTGQSTSFGHRRYADTFVYGGEFNLINKDGLIKATNINIMMGYQPIWKHRVTPYLLGYIGNSQAKYTVPVTGQKVKSSGYVTGLDLGFRIKVFQPIHVTGGMRYEKYNYSKKQIDAMSNQEFYILLGFEF